MDIQSRKIHLIQESHKVQSKDSEFSPISIEQFNAEIDKSYKDSISGNVLSSKELKEEIKGWN